MPTQMHIDTHLFRVVEAFDSILHSSLKSVEAAFSFFSWKMFMFERSIDCGCCIFSFTLLLAETATFSLITNLVRAHARVLIYFIMIA